MWPQLGIGQSYNPMQQFGVGSSPASGFSSMGLSPAASGGFWSGLHGPQLSDWGGGVGALGQVMAASGVLNDIFTQRDPNQGWLGAGLQGALQGAGAGSMFGWPGAAIGAPVGYVAGKK